MSVLSQIPFCCYLSSTSWPWEASCTFLSHSTEICRRSLYVYSCVFLFCDILSLIDVLDMHLSRAVSQSWAKTKSFSGVGRLHISSVKKRFLHVNIRVILNMQSFKPSLIMNFSPSFLIYISVWYPNSCICCVKQSTTF